MEELARMKRIVLTVSVSLVGRDPGASRVSWFPKALHFLLFTAGGSVWLMVNLNLDGCWFRDDSRGGS